MNAHRIRLVVWCAVVAVVMVTVGACSQPSEQSVPAGQLSQAPAGGVDPQVLSDVVAGAFPMPGPTQRRTIRVRHAARSIANVACGGPSLGDLDSTGDRFNQARYADLELIADKGLVEHSAGPDGGPERVDLSGGCVDEVLPSYEEWMALGAPWNDVTRTAVHSSAVTATELETAECLTANADVPQVADLDPADPTATFLSRVVDSALAATDGHDQWLAEMRRLSDVFVDCADGYFDAMQAELEPERDRLVERNRELLKRFASELSAAGYVP